MDKHWIVFTLSENIFFSSLHKNIIGIQFCPKATEDILFKMKAIFEETKIVAYSYITNTPPFFLESNQSR
jgi:hypothetical protein